MKKNVMRIFSLVMVVALMVATFAGCGGSEVNRPEAVTVKTDLGDVNFTFTYGELKKRASRRPACNSL